MIEYFYTIAKIPHCSLDAHLLRDYLVDFGKNCGYEVQIDNAQNILICKGKPKLCLQAHYDMVCVGDAPDIQVYEEDGYLRAKNSSLGADNGMAIAMMMAFMRDGYELEFLFTADEEVGLVGANQVDFELQSSYMLNLDSEEEGEICIGCAGGVDIKASKALCKQQNEYDCYEVSLSGLPGGHSGVDIDKNIPNAIVEVAKYLEDKDCKVVDIGGGERINSIPANASAIVASSKELFGDDNLVIKKVAQSSFCYQKEIPKILSDFKHGILEFHKQLRIPNASQNLALVSIDNDILNIEVSLRAMGMDKLDSISQETVKYFQDLGFEVEKKDKYPAWKPEQNSFTALVEKSMQHILGRSELRAIHAGLECGVLKQKYPHILFASIGPTIRYPHSIREEVDMDSVDRTFEVVCHIISVLYHKEFNV